MDSKKCSKCEATRPLSDYARRKTGVGVHGVCKPCQNIWQRARYAKLIAYRQPTNANDFDFTDEEATNPGAPAFDDLERMPDGHRIKGLSTLVDADGQVKLQWIKTTAQHSELDDLLEAIRRLGDEMPKPDAEPMPEIADDDLLCVYPMGDPHLGMYAWAAECGADFDVKIAEHNLFAAVDHLVALAPPAKRALIINLGDFFHSDNKSGTTTAGTKLDTDGRWSKVLSVGLRTMRRCIDRALEKHELVDVICEIGNHDSHAAVMLGIALAQFYEREPRVRIDTSPATYHWYRFDRVLIGVTHGHDCKVDRLLGVMANDRASDWGETVFRFWYTGHVHHDTVKELQGVTVETFRTLAPRDEFHSRMGYRSGQDMKLDVIHRKHGRIMRHVVGIEQIRRSA